MSIGGVVKRFNYRGVGTWAARPLTGNQEGDWYQVSSGPTYRWSAIYDAWVRADIYAYGTLVLDARIDGDVTPANETPAWVDTTAGGGTITSDGTLVRWNGSAADADTCYSTYTHGQAAKNYYVTGLLTLVSSSGTAVARAIVAKDGSRWIGVDLSQAAGGNSRFVSTAGAAVGTGAENAGYATEAQYELWVQQVSSAAGHAMYWTGNAVKPTGLAALTAFSASAANDYAIGDHTGAVGRGDTKGRLLRFGRIT